MEMDRRAFMKLAAAAGAGSMFPLQAWAESPPATTQAAAAPMSPPPRLQYARFPEKTDLILLTDRPPQLETPLKYFKTDLTPNSAFFVRWHESAIPTTVDLRTFRLAVAGQVDKPLSLSVEDLKTQFQPQSFAAVVQCSGNSRSLFEPRVGGGEWGHGAVGCAKWTGVPLRDVLKAAGVKNGAVQVSFGGLDRAPLPDTPRFMKALDFAHANDGEVMVAYAMNDAPLPMLNGFPIRLVVPGWYATYWVKALSEINVLSENFKSFWMDKAYRIPNNPDANETPTNQATDTVPINRQSCRSILISPSPMQKVEMGSLLHIEGVAIDAGEGITKVEVSTDGGKTWADAKLDEQSGRFAWRRFHLDWEPPAVGAYRIMSRATNAKGETQTTTQWNHSGYQRNLIEHVDITVFEGGHL